MESKNTYSVTEASAYSGLSNSKINYLCREGLLMPSEGHNPGRGIARKYTFGDIVMLRAIERFLTAGIRVGSLKTSLAAIRSRHSEITPYSLPSKYIITDGTEVFFHEEGESLEVLKNGQLAFAFVLELQSLQNEVINVLRKAS